MQKIRIATICVVAALASYMQAQTPTDDQLIDSIYEYGLAQYFMRFSEAQQTLAQKQEDMGRTAFEQWYDALLAKAESRFLLRRTFSDVPMTRIYRQWQTGALPSAQARTRMQEQLEQCKQLFTDRSAAYQMMCRLMVDFLCRTGQYAEAEKLHESTRDWYRNSEAPAHEWLRERWIVEEMMIYLGQSKMVMADIRQGNFTDRLRSKHRLYLYSMTYDSLRIAYEPQFGEAPQVAAEALPALVPLPSGNQRLEALFSYYNALLRLPLPLKGKQYVVRHIAEDGRKLLWEAADTMPQRETLARIFYQAAEAAQQVDMDEAYHHNSNETTHMQLWRMAMVSGRIAYGRPPARAMLGYATGWIRKGYPLNALPLCQEAVEAMRRELADTTPPPYRQRLQQADRKWLQTELSVFASLTAANEAYRPIVAALQQMDR